MEWIAWNEGDPIPEPGHYWVTASGIDGPETYLELLGNFEWRSWRYNGVTAYMPREATDDYIGADRHRPPPYERPESERGTRRCQ